MKSENPIYLTWLNHLGGFEYFLFTALKEFQIEITDSKTTTQNIFPNWPNSWGQNADTITKKVSTTGKNKIVVKSQHLTENQIEAIKLIKISPVVQIVTSRSDRRTVIVDSDSFRVSDEVEKLFALQFSITYTNEIASQKL